MACQVADAWIAWSTRATVGILFKQVCFSVGLGYFRVICFHEKIENVVVFQLNSAVLIVDNLGLNYQLP